MAVLHPAFLEIGGKKDAKPTAPAGPDHPSAYPITFQIRGNGT
jgi:hypothetical protein